ncbi:MAG: DEAD/DEAH box helicase, partial [Phycisphaerae bacterium]|nr:DEAD/DEAH box helicase [Phycisphaerae bacterium]
MARSRSQSPSGSPRVSACAAPAAARSREATHRARATPVAHISNVTSVRVWFASRGWSPFEYQVRAWDAYAAGRSGLVQVPTGAGKTYAAFGGPLQELIDESLAKCDDAPSPRTVRVLYITPLRAVSRDIELALRAPIESMGLPCRVESRTGDTSASARVKQRERLPEVLVTTPESLSLMLTWPDAPQRFAGLRAAIVDEWHELLTSKRGTQVELALSRLRSFAPALRTWALTATISNAAEAARAIVGATGEEPVIVTTDLERRVRLDTVLPAPGDPFPWAGHLGLSMLERVVESIDPARSTLVFTNTRSQAERWYQAILSRRPEWERVAALHHGSIDRDRREEIEHALKHGTIRIVVATSSLDLGVDFAPVERVMQIGSPKGIARLMQRAGRAAHRPGEDCRITCVPTHGLELLEVAAVRMALERGEVEPRKPADKPLDVLAQHIVTCAMGGGFTEDTL